MNRQRHPRAKNSSQTALTKLTDAKLPRFHSTGHVAALIETKQVGLVEAMNEERFSTLLATDLLFQSNDERHFYGPFAHLRKKLDDKYHVVYRKERQWLQDSVVEDLLEHVNDDPSKKGAMPTEPWFIYVAGTLGTQSTIVQQLVRDGRLPLLSFVIVDPEDIRQRLPEFNTFVQRKPELVESLTRKETGYIAEILTLAALQAGKNVVLYGSLHSANWYTGYCRRLRETYEGLKIGLIWLKTATKEMAISKARRLYLSFWNSKMELSMEEVYTRLPRSVEILKPETDYYCQITNHLERLDIENTSWKQFSATFLQKTAWMPGTTGKKHQRRTRLASAADRTAAKEAVLNKRQRRRFSVHRSSEENNKTDETKYYGKFSHLRETLDYSYHANYTFERQHFQDSIVTHFLNGVHVTDKKNGAVGSTPTRPWIVFTAGAMGAGKSYTMKRLAEKGLFPLKAFVVVDPDEIRRRLPEFRLYASRNPELAGELTRKEAGFMAEILTLAALHAGKNVMLDGSLRDAEWYKQYFQRLREQFKTLRLCILYVTAPREAVFQRAAERAMTTGRIVPRNVLVSVLEQVPKSVKVLSPLVDYFAELENAPGSDIELKTPGETWESFRKQWEQTLRYVPSRWKFSQTTQSISDSLVLCGSREM